MKAKAKRESEGTDEEESLDFAALYHTMLEKWWLIVLCFIFTIGMGVFYIAITPKQYMGETVVQVQQAPSQVLNVEDVTSEDLKEDAILKTIETNFTGAALLVNVIDRLKLTPEQLNMKPRPQRPYNKEEMAAALYDEVSAKLTKGTRLITIDAYSTDPKRAMEISSALVEEYLRAEMAQRTGVSGEANRFLLEQADVLKQRVAIAEQAAQAFKDAHPGRFLDDAITFNEDKLRDLANRVSDTRAIRIRLEADNAQVQKILARTQPGPRQCDELLTVQSVATDNGVLQIEKSISDEQAVFAALKQRYLPKHPAYVQEQSKVAGLQVSLQDAVLNVAKGLTTAVAAAKQSEEEVNQVYNEQQKSKLDDDRLSIPYSALTREVDRVRNLYDSVQERLKETDLTVNMNDNEIEVVSPATLPYAPAKPKVVLVIAACVLGGGLLSMCACYALSMTDESLRTIDQAEERLGLQAVGAIPIGHKLGFVDELGILKEPDGAIAESFRTLRAALGLLDKGDTHRTHLFTSGVPGEGKSFCSINYAISMAQLGRKTLLVDADLRLPSIEAVFFKQKQAQGLSMLLQGEAFLEECYHATPVPNLFVMPAGRRAQNPSELLANTDFPKVVASFAAEFDEVVIDTAPVHAVSDTLLIARFVDVVCLVVHAGKTPAKVVERAINRLKEADANVAGFILNRLPRSGGNYYYYYGTDDSYGKGVYGAREASKERA
jgi:succinoglycan biosynthesis transport protein ExoP